MEEQIWRLCKGLRNKLREPSIKL